MALNVVVEAEKKFIARVSKDGGDVDIWINDTLIAYIEADSGRLLLIDGLDKALAGSGIALDSEGMVQIG